MKNNIVLIGFMGVGKGTTARKLAELTGLYALDCDDLIESLVNAKVKKIFKDHGEKHFRSLEKKTAIWLEKNVQGTIVSTGGGFYGVDNLKSIGKVVLLHGDFDQIIERLLQHPNAAKKIKKRPLLQNMGKARELYERRLPFYREVADVEICVDERKVEDICNEIMEKLALKKMV